MKEIFTFNLGFYGNFSSSYFWQIQDMSSKPLSFHQSCFIQSQDSYFPRMLGIDLKESISFPVQTSKQESEVLWGGKIQKINQDESTEEKWTDLLSGMISRKNILPVYRDFSPLEELEDQIRYFSESSDRLQGIHTLLDSSFSSLFIQGIEILSDFYPKSPNLILSFNQKFSLEERKAIWNLSEYGNALLVPCTEVKSKTDLSEVALALEVLSFQYRSFEDMSFYIEKFLRFSHGNTCEISLNNRNFSNQGVIFTEAFFLRDDSDPLILPEGFKVEASQQYLCKLFQSSNLESFYSDFLTTRGVSEEDLESHNYILSLKEVYSDLDFLD
jgi:hypothetical protein